MLARFDKFNRFEKPKLALCNPGSKLNNDGCIQGIIGYISDTEAEENVLNFNSPSELNFRVNKPETHPTINYDGAIETINRYLRNITASDFLGINSGTGVIRIPNISDLGLESDLLRLDIIYEWQDASIGGMEMRSAGGGTWGNTITATGSYTLRFSPNLSANSITVEIPGGAIPATVDDPVISFTVSLASEPPQQVESSVYNKIQNRRVIYEEGLGFFVITGVDKGFEGDKEYKDVKAESAEVELQQKMLPYIEDGTYPLVHPAGSAEIGILEIVVASLPLWEIDTVGTGLDQKYRTFEDIDESKNCLAFLLEDLQDAFECIFTFDTTNRRISVYAQESFVSDSGIIIDRDTVVNSIKITENSDELYTALSVHGDNDLVVADVNPVSSNVVYNFDYYLDWMSDGLRERVIAWKNGIASIEEYFKSTSLDLNRKYDQKTSLQADIDKYNILLEIYNRCWSNMSATGDGTTITSKGKNVIDTANAEIGMVADEDSKIPSNIIATTEIATAQTKIGELIGNVEDDRDGAMAEIEDIDVDIGIIETALNNIRNTYRLDQFFASGGFLDELSLYIYEGKYTDEYMTVTDGMDYEERASQAITLYERAKDQLKRVSEPTQEFDIDTESFVFDKNFSHWTNNLELGCLINIELERGDFAPLFLSGMTINYCDHKMSLKFGNRYNKFDVRSLFEDTLGKIDKSANTLDFVKSVIYPIKAGEINKMREELQSARDISMGDALASTNEVVSIDNTGYTGRSLESDGEYSGKQIKITGRNIVFTEDGWETCSTAIGEMPDGNYGINAQVVYGDLIIGNGLVIRDNGGEDLLTVIDGKIQSNVEDVKKTITDGLSQVTQNYTTITQTASAIQSVAEEIKTVNDGIDARIASQVTQSADALEVRIASLEAADGAVVRATGYTFDKDGLKISKSGEGVSNKIDNTGMYVSAADGTELLTVNDSGVDSLNLTARKYLTIGSNSRFEDYIGISGDNRTGCFFVGTPSSSS